jgi:DNA polymerase-3 subunit gamma/tau
MNCIGIDDSGGPADRTLRQMKTASLIMGKTAWRYLMKWCHAFSVMRLIEGYAYTRPPRYKVIIIEVHMLSVNAFNALLKTLEEHPSTSNHLRDDRNHGFP